MMRVEAKYYDGKSSVEELVEIEFTENKRVLISSHFIDAAFEEIEIESRLGDTPRVIEFPSGQRCKVDDNDTLDQILKMHGVQKSYAHRLESSWKLSIAAVVVTALFIWFMFTSGAAYSANIMASFLPKNTLDNISKITLEILEKEFLRKSTLSLETQIRIKMHFEKLTQGDKRYHLHIRSAPKIGANAFALPSGDIVLTDQLVRFSKDKDLRDILGVLAHEKGHVYHQHSLKNAIKTSISGVVIGYLTGDISILITTLPTVLIESSYSRDFEREADEYAAKELKRLGISTKYIADLFEKLDKKNHGNDTIYNKYTDSHPLTKERIEYFRGFIQ